MGLRAARCSSISFGYAMITFYESPLPGLGISFSNLITDQTAFLASILSARSVQNAQESLTTLWNALEQPDPWSILANLLYWGMLLLIGLAQFALLFVVSFGMIASAVCALLGPLFIPFFIVPTLEWLFWNWLKAFVQYSFMPVVANAFILVFERFLSRYLQTLPPGLRLEEQLLYGVHAVMILLTFTVGVLLVPVAHQLDLLGSLGRVRAARPRRRLVRRTSMMLFLSLRESTCVVHAGRSARSSLR